MLDSILFGTWFLGREPWISYLATNQLDITRGHPNTSG